jgi:hypothetical protein
VLDYHFREVVRRSNNESNNERKNPPVPHATFSLLLKEIRQHGRALGANGRELLITPHVSFVLPAALTFISARPLNPNVN